MQGALLTHQDAHHHKGRHALTDHSGQAHTGHAHIKHDHKNQVEHHIHKARSRQAIQRAAGVAHAAQQRRAEVVDHGDGHAAKVNAQIQNRHIQHIGGGAHGRQQGPGSQNAHHGQHAAADHAQQHGGVYGFLHAVIITRAVIAAGGHIGTHGKADEKIHQHIDDGSIAAHGGQCGSARKAPHNHLIGCVEQKLQHTAGRKRQCE